MKRVFDNVSRGLLLITIGIIFFLLNYGYLSWGFWAHVIDLWPLILILAGIGLLFNRRIPFSAILLIFILSMVGYSLVVGDNSMPDQMLNKLQSNVSESGTFDVSLPPDVKKAKVELELGGTQVQVKTLNTESNPGKVQLMTGTYRGESGSSASDTHKSPVEVMHSGDTITAKLSSASTAGNGPRSIKELSLNLSPEVRYDLNVEAGAINGKIDLSQLLVEQFKISTGASDFELEFGDTGLTTEGKIDSGASKVVLVVPENVGLKIRFSGVASNTNFMGSGLLLEDKNWLSPNFAQAKSKVDLEISTAAGSLQLKRPKVMIR
ncbi:hypothetical protein Desor_1085 [Desulfosporosinus orientis DSM 765]|uniref:LiaI-LiaF-like transmembrane region domain-containing protein n=1 Tax=Desulfosporosinus orientis (strain ATCC 19365 / DSM 765 / NCIMB 8382 / VKM B-1628 / Singapore I) TaxID=768706 RepID=G7WAJ1_DESOD|nr:DUF5668 domain-containing protein [Desulfosporosinus orientis]AET66759.1 hypothetical protein Desor_1085 [Desulfosporosinus orientis DSM 765]